MLRTLVDRICALTAVGRPPVVCLGFHAIADDGSLLSLPPARFRAFVASLVDRGLRGMSVAEWRASLPDPGTAAVLTFDDGFASVHRHALPALREAGFTATVFPIVAGLGRTADWRAGGLALPRTRLLEAGELRELAAAGWEVGGHTVDHVDLAAVDPGVARDQVRECRTRLEDLLGAPVHTFAYPYGRTSEAAVQAVRAAGFAAAVTTRPGPLDTRRPLRLDRFMLSPRTGPAGLRACFGPALPAVERALGRYARVLPGTDCSTFVEAAA